MSYVLGYEKCVQALAYKPEYNDRLEDLDVDGRIILKRVLKKMDGMT